MKVTIKIGFIDSVCYHEEHVLIFLFLGVTVKAIKPPTLELNIIVVNKN